MKRIVSIFLALALICCMIPTAFAASSEANGAADALNALGLFNGTGTDANGKPIYDLDRAPTRAEAVTMLVRLLGKESEAKAGTWATPFTDVQDWAKPYVGYAYVNKLTSGTGATTFGGSSVMTATQYITLVLRALGYESGTDFQWDKAWELSDKIGMTDGRYKADGNTFLRGDVAIISSNALYINKKGSETTIYQSIVSDKLVVYRVKDGASSVWSIEPIPAETNTTEQLKLDGLPDGETLTWKSSDTSIATVENGLVTIKNKAGLITITVTTSTGITKEQQIKVSVSADDFYNTFHAAFTEQPTRTHVYRLVYNGNLSRAKFVDEFSFGSIQWKECAQRYAEEIEAKDKYASVIGFYLPGSGSATVFLGSVSHNESIGYSQWWESSSKIAGESF